MGSSHCHHDYGVNSHVISSTFTVVRSYHYLCDNICDTSYINHIEWNVVKKCIMDFLCQEYFAVWLIASQIKLLIRDWQSPTLLLLHCRLPFWITITNYLNLNKYSIEVRLLHYLSSLTVLRVCPRSFGTQVSVRRV